MAQTGPQPARQAQGAVTVEDLARQVTALQKQLDRAKTTTSSVGKSTQDVTNDLQNQVEKLSGQVFSQIDELRKQIAQQVDIIKTLDGKLDRENSAITEQQINYNVSRNKLDDTDRQIKDRIDSMDKQLKGEDDRVAQDIQPSISWMNTIITSGGVVVSIFGALITGLIIYFSISNTAIARASAKEIAEQTAKEMREQNAKEQVAHEARLDLTIGQVEQEFKSITREKNEVKLIRGHIDGIHKEMQEHAQNARQVLDDMRVLAETAAQTTSDFNRDVEQRLGPQAGAVSDQEKADLAAAAGDAGIRSNAEREYIALFNQAKAALDQNRAYEGFPALQKAEEIAPNEDLQLAAVDAQALVLSCVGEKQAAIDLLNDKITRAKEDLARLPALAPRVARLLMHRGEMLAAKQLAAPALACLDEAAELVRQSTDTDALEIFGRARYAAGWLLYQAKDYRGAISRYGEVALRCGRSPDPRLRVLAANAIQAEGRALIEEQRYADAISSIHRLRYYQSDVPLAPRLAMAKGWNDKGIAHSQINERKAAIETFDYVIALFDKIGVEPSLLDQAARAKALRSHLL